jgi:hypothetical protein
MQSLKRILPNFIPSGFLFHQFNSSRIVYFLIVFSAAFPVNQALARLGESEIAIEKRFGEPQRSVPQDANLPKKLQERASTRVYQIAGNQDGALIEVTFLDGKSCREFYFLEREKSQTSRGLNDAQVRFILEVNAQGSGWDPSSSGKANHSTSWKRKDREALAEFRETAPSINLNQAVPLQSQLLIWSGIEVRAKAWDDFTQLAETEIATLRKQQAIEAKKRLQQEMADQQLLQGI